MTVAAPTAAPREAPASAGHWLFGSARAFAAAPHLFPAELGWRHGGLARFRVLRMRFLAVTHPDYARQILVTRQERYARSYHYRNGQVILGRGLLSTDGDHWLKRRRQMLPAFRADRLQNLVPATCDAVAALLARWEAARRQGEPVPAVLDMQRLSLSVIGRALLSTEVGLDDADRFGQAVRETLRLMRERNTSWFAPPVWWPTAGNRQLHATRNSLDEFVDSHIGRRGAADDGRPRDILNALLRARDAKTGEAIGAKGLREETKTLFVAGFETTATALAWALHALARHPEAAARWHEELDQVLAGRPPGIQDLHRLPFTAAIVSETLRLYPPVYNVVRECVSADDIAGVAIRPGDLMMISIFGIHRAAQWWREPEAFRPERFLPPAEWPRDAYLPFASGKHTCIGDDFALTEMLVALALIGQRYRVELVDHRPPAMVARITLAPAREIPLRLIAR